MVYWQALYTQIEPMPEERADIRAGVIGSLSIAPHMKRGHSPPRPLDYFWWVKQPQASVAAMKDTFKTIKKAWAKRKNRGNSR